jgi:hypothetical protein
VYPDATVLLLLPTASAYETDQLTDRLRAFVDVAPEADAKADELLQLAARRTNEETRCRASPRATARILASHIYAVTSHPEFVKNRGELQGLGYGAYAAWLESAPGLDRRTFTDRDDIYGELKPTESLVLGTVGVCSTVQIAGVRMGTDKPDHFWEQGYEYLVASAFGRHDEAAVRWGTWSELGTYGLLTSNVFSFADLYANWQGYQFYKELLQPGGVMQRDDDGCVTEARPFHWSEWLDDAADEVYDPPVYTKRVRESVRAHLAEERDVVCADYARWGTEASARRAEIVAREAPHASSEAPSRVDEWGLDDLCGPTTADGTAP